MNNDSRFLFRYVVVSDTHVRPSVIDDSSPWPVNARANARARYAVELINRAAPAFVLHLGDVVHPLPSLSSYEDAISEAKEILAGLDAPLHVIPGNHDIGDKPMPGLPAAPVDAESIEKFRANFGEDWQAFEHGGCRFVLLNVELLSSGLEREQVQKAWLEAELARPFAGRTFVFTHYPTHILAPDEPSNYDNLDEPARSWLMGLIAQANVSAVFSGHVHNFFHNRVGGTDFYVLPSTSFVRQDYAEFFRQAPAAELGRDDAAKLGFLVIDVFEDAVVVHTARTLGLELEARGAAAGSTAEHRAMRQIPPVGWRGNRLGVNLRHDWAEVVKLPFNGPMDEFLRKEARNDYTLFNLVDFGVRKVRVPLRDFDDPSYRERLELLCELGIEITAFQFGIPGEATLSLVERHAAQIATFEIIAPWQERHALLAAIAARRATLPVRLALACITSSADGDTVGSQFAHYVSYGFSESRWEEVADFSRTSDTAGLIDAFVFTVPVREGVIGAVERLGHRARELGIGVNVNVRLASEIPSEVIDDDALIAARVAEAVIAACAWRDQDLFLDTFNSLDRGYFPRTGLCDRLLNPTPAGEVYRNLGLVLQDDDIGIDAASAGDTLALEAAGEKLILVGAPGRQGLPSSSGWLLLGDGCHCIDVPEGHAGPLLACRREWLETRAPMMLPRGLASS